MKLSGWNKNFGRKTCFFSNWTNEKMCMKEKRDETKRNNGFICMKQVNQMDKTKRNGGLMGVKSPPKEKPPICFLNFPPMEISLSRS